MTPATTSPLPSPARTRALQHAPARVVRGQPARPALATHHRPLRDPGQRDHAAADTGAAGRAALRRVARRVARPREPGRGAARRRAAALAGPRLQQPGPAAAGVRRGGRRRRAGRPPGGAAAHARRPARAARHRARTRRAPSSSSPTTTTLPRWTPTCAACSPTSSTCRRTSPTQELQAVADAVLPRGRSRDWHNALMDYGSLVLTARTTGIAARTRQGTFEGSRRQKRARLLRRLLHDRAAAARGAGAVAPAAARRGGGARRPAASRRPGHGVRRDGRRRMRARR